MRAVNLIPAGGGRDGRGGQSVASWGVLGVLGLLLVGMLVYVLTNNQIADRRAQLATVQTQVQAIQAKADAGRPYKEFAALAQARVETIRQLGAARFDWHRAFADLAQVIPSDVALSSLLGTVAPGVGVQGGGTSDTGTLRAALPNPAIELSGCTAGHDGVARLISRLRLMTGVVRVSLSGSTEAPDAGSTGASAGTGASPGGGCPVHGVPAQFGIVVFFQPIPAVPTPTAPDLSGGATGSTGAPAAAATTPAPAAGAATPAASTTPGAGTTPVPSAGSGPTGTAATTPSGTGTGSGSAAP